MYNKNCYTNELCKFHPHQPFIAPTLRKKKIKAIDHGYLYLKDSDRNMFLSAYKKNGVVIEGTKEISFSNSSIMIDQLSFTVGSGERNTDFNKINSELNRILTLYDLALSGSGDYYLGVDLPIDQYPLQKAEFKEKLLSYNDSKVIYNGEELDINICDVIVVPQGIGALVSMNKPITENCILFDFGGYSIDIAYIEIINGNPVVVDHCTFISGIQKIYPKLISVYNSVAKTSYSPNYAETILRNFNKPIHINSEAKITTTEFLIPVLEEFLGEILKEFELRFPAKDTKIYLCGGSAIIFQTLFEKRYGTEMVELISDSQFANALGNKYVAEQVFGSIVNEQNVVDVDRSKINEAF